MSPKPSVPPACGHAACRPSLWPGWGGTTGLSSGWSLQAHCGRAPGTSPPAVPHVQAARLPSPSGCGLWGGAVQCAPTASEISPASPVTPSTQAGHGRVVPGPGVCALCGCRFTPMRPRAPGAPSCSRVAQSLVPFSLSQTSLRGRRLSGLLPLLPGDSVGLAPPGRPPALDGWRPALVFWSLRSLWGVASLQPFF